MEPELPELRSQQEGKVHNESHAQQPTRAGAAPAPQKGVGPEPEQKPGVGREQKGNSPRGIPGRLTAHRWCLLGR